MLHVVGRGEGLETDSDRGVLGRGVLGPKYAVHGILVPTLSERGTGDH